MSHLKLPFHEKDLFSFHKTKPRKMTSRASYGFNAQELAREFGSVYQEIDVHIGYQRFILDVNLGIWKYDKTTNTTINPQNEAILEKRKEELEEDNNVLRTKIDILITMLAETIAEEELTDSQ
ncbi:unnamed protein product [Adineta steineri]|uniref:Uncharacterized protein n=1 Tax=Adineta steineri TaxID=433720 RepID=A0A813NQD6_9BILA|nr:unnamed protein product [Adineta steineri]CAF0754940.1 unnamed protein product [Adineta steineri]CAF0871096.1 unnamed protein product [Adineta steineri]